MYVKTQETSGKEQLTWSKEQGTSNQENLMLFSSPFVFVRGLAFRG